MLQRRNPLVIATPIPAATIVLAGAILVLATAWMLQAFGVQPCELCLKQRYPYYAAIPIASVALIVARHNQQTAAKFLLFALSVIFIASAIFASYHAGVEWHFWAGPTECTGDFAKTSTMANFQKQLKEIRVIRCDEVSLRIFGLSLAVWDIFASITLTFFATYGAISKNRKK